MARKWGPAWATFIPMLSGSRPLRILSFFSFTSAVHTWTHSGPGMTLFKRMPE